MYKTHSLIVLLFLTVYLLRSRVQSTATEKPESNDYCNAICKLRAQQDCEKINVKIDFKKSLSYEFLFVW